MEQEKFNWKAFIIDKVIIALFISIATIVFQYYNNRSIERLRNSNEKELINLRKSNEKDLELIKQRHESSITQLKTINDNQLQENEFIHQTRQLEKRLDQELVTINERFQNEIKKINKNVEADDQRKINEERLRYITRQLSEFYWPILYRLEKNKSVYSLLGNPFVGSIIDNEIILPNHQQILEIIEKYYFLAQPDDETENEINKYIAHVSLYMSLRKEGYKGFPQDFGGQDFATVFLYNVVKTRTEYLQKQYEILLDSSLNILSINDGINYDYSSNLKNKALMLTGNVITNKSHSDSSRKIEYYEYSKVIKSAFTNNSYYDTIIIKKEKTGTDIFAIAFKNYIPEEDLFKFEVGSKAVVGNHNGEIIYIKKNQPFTYKFNMSSVRITAGTVWEEKERKIDFKKRTKVEVRLEQWIKRE